MSIFLLSGLVALYLNCIFYCVNGSQLAYARRLHATRAATPHPAAVESHYPRLLDFLRLTQSRINAVVEDAVQDEQVEHYMNSDIERDEQVDYMNSDIERDEQVRQRFIPFMSVQDTDAHMNNFIKEPNSVSWIVSFEWSDMQVCTGALIAVNLVLAPRACLDAYHNLHGPVKLYSHRYNLNKTATQEEAIRWVIIRVVNYNSTTMDDLLESDPLLDRHELDYSIEDLVIFVVEMARPTVNGSYTFITYAQPDHTDKAPLSLRSPLLHLVGWSRDPSCSSISYSKQHLSLHPTCQRTLHQQESGMIHVEGEWAPLELTDRMVCSIQTEASFEMGSALIRLEYNQPILYGFLIYETTVDSRTIKVFVDISKYTPWIEKVESYYGLDNNGDSMYYRERRRAREWLINVSTLSRLARRSPDFIPTPQEESTSDGSADSVADTSTSEETSSTDEETYSADEETSSARDSASISSHGSSTNDDCLTSEDENMNPISETSQTTLSNTISSLSSIEQNEWLDHPICDQSTAIFLSNFFRTTHLPRRRIRGYASQCGSLMPASFRLDRQQ